MSKWIKTQDRTFINLDRFSGVYIRQLRPSSSTYDVIAYVDEKTEVRLFESNGYDECAAYMEALAAHIGAVNPIGEQP